MPRSSDQPIIARIKRVRRALAMWDAREQARPEERVVLHEPGPLGRQALAALERLLLDELLRPRLSADQRN
jgi:hypothetical protein